MRFAENGALVALTGTTVASATNDARIVLATGLAAAAAESISMAAVAYTSSLARGDLGRLPWSASRRALAGYVVGAAFAPR